MTRADAGPGGEVLVDGQRHQPEHAVGHGDVEMGAPARRGRPGQRGGDGERRVHAAGRRVGDRGSRQRRGTPSGPGALMAR